MRKGKSRGGWDGREKLGDFTVARSTPFITRWLPTVWRRV